MHSKMMTILTFLLNKLIDLRICWFYKQFIRRTAFMDYWNICQIFELIRFSFGVLLLSG